MNAPTKSWGTRVPVAPPTPTAKPVMARAASAAAPATGPRETVRLNVELPANLRRRVKARCAIDGRDIRDVVIELLESWLAKK